MTIRLLSLTAACAFVIAGCSRASLPGNPLVPTVPAFDVPATSSGYAVVHFFGKDNDGNEPEASLIGLRGVLYGTTFGGGSSNHGTVFESTQSGNEKVLHSFGTSEGYYPDAGLLAVRGALYGTTESGPGSSGGGTLFEITSSGTERVLHTFGGPPNDGANPEADLIAANGTMYGTTTYGGKYNLGTVFSSGTGGRESILYSFKNRGDGGRPAADLTYLDGTLYGTAGTGGTNGNGVVFGVTLNGGEKVLHRFKGGVRDGSSPHAGLKVLRGMLYGTTFGGGSTGQGTVFSVTTTGSEKIVYNFTGSGSHGPDGSSPQADLIANDGTLYGTTLYGGKYGNGTVFSVTTSGLEKVLYSFKGGKQDGAFPGAGVLDLSGTLYGTAAVGGKYAKEGKGDDGGVLFRLTP
ncbi:MAG: hypothetical protein JO113_05960 [Candidatus Eremiobacteraeota bacterium]|nr:hypothetical protein [Candidatus Eremiobacteraeota bacterium]